MPDCFPKWLHHFTIYSVVWRFCMTASLVSQSLKNLPAVWETWVRSLGWEDPLVEGMKPTPVFLPGESPWTEEPGGLQSVGSQRVGHSWASKHSTEEDSNFFMSLLLFDLLILAIPLLVKYLRWLLCAEFCYKQSYQDLFFTIYL